MYKTLIIGGQEYKLEYSVEASLYADCTTSIMKLTANVEEGDKESNIEKILSGVSNIPQTALTLFYAGLMEYHGDHPDGDGKVPNKQTAKRLISLYIKEHTEDDSGNFYSILNMCMDQMKEDGFFKLTGLEAMLSAGEDETDSKKKTPKVPQDHKKAAKK